MSSWLVRSTPDQDFRPLESFLSARPCRLEANNPAPDSWNLKGWVVTV